MDLSPEQTKDFESKILKLSEFAQTIGLKITDAGAQRKTSSARETSPEEIKISSVRNLSGGAFIQNVYECRITYLSS